MRAAFHDTEPLRLHELSADRWRVHAIVGDVMAGLIVVALAFAPFPTAGPRNVADYAILLAPALLLPLRRRLPLAVLAACIALYGAAALGDLDPPGVVVGTAIAMFGVANRSERLRTTIVAASTIVTVAGLTLIATRGDIGDPRVLQFAVTIAFFAAIGDATRSRRKYITAMVERAERAERTREAEAQRRVSEERLRIARDLHDVVAHQISVISLNAGVASSSLATRPERAQESLATIRTAARTVLGEIGDLLSMLRADGDEQSAAPQPGLDALDTLLEAFRGSGLDVHARREGAVGGLPAAVGVVAYRVVQEGLTNALKHGVENRAHILVAVTERDVEVVVVNPMRPPMSERAAVDHSAFDYSGYGLIGLRERVASVRGTLEAGPAAGGFRLAVSLPLMQEEEPTSDGPPTIETACTTGRRLPTDEPHPTDSTPREPTA